MRRRRRSRRRRWCVRRASVACEMRLAVSASSSSGWRSGGRTGRVQVLPDAAGVLAGVAGAHRLEVAGDAVARPDLDRVADHPRLEAVERSNRRAADHLALEVVDTAVAGADEVAGGFDEAHRTAEVGAAGRDRDELLRVLAEIGAAATDVDRGLARVAGALDDRDHRLPVGVLGEVPGRADTLPRLLGVVEDRREGEADGGQGDRRHADDGQRPARRRRTPSGESSSRLRSSPRVWASRGHAPRFLSAGSAKSGGGGPPEVYCVGRSP